MMKVVRRLKEKMPLSGRLLANKLKQFMILVLNFLCHCYMEMNKAVSENVGPIR